VAKSDPEGDEIERLAADLLARKDLIKLRSCAHCGWETALGDPDEILICLRCGGVTRPDQVGRPPAL
jgi:hypothetical protein